MRRLTLTSLAALSFLPLVSCSRLAPPPTHAAAPPAAATGRDFRVTGIVQAVHSVRIVVPQIQGQYSMMALTRLISSGSRVKQGDLIATFDPAQQMDAAREAKGKFEDLGHQVDQKIAENRANAEKRTADLRQAEGDLAKAQLELQKGPTLGEIDRLQNEARAEGARTRLESLKKSSVLREKTETAALRILELQRDRQRIAMQRAEDNIRKLEIRAPQDGMVVLENTYRGGAWGRPQEGDQMYRGYPIASIFEPDRMQVRCSVNEPDILALAADAPASVYLDAYPDLMLHAHFLFASVVASSGIGSPIKTFTAIFAIDKPDPRLLPDLSAAVVLPKPSPGAPRGPQ